MISMLNNRPLLTLFDLKLNLDQFKIVSSTSRTVATDQAWAGQLSGHRLPLLFVSSGRLLHGSFFRWC